MNYTSLAAIQAKSTVPDQGLAVERTPGQALHTLRMRADPTPMWTGWGVKVLAW